MISSIAMRAGRSLLRISNISTPVPTSCNRYASCVARSSTPDTLVCRTSFASHAAFSTTAAYPEGLPPRVRHKKSNKRALRIMNELQKEGMDNVDLSHVAPFSPGDAVEVHWKDSSEDVKGSIYKGICIWQRKKGLASTFRIINYYEQTDYMEMSFPLYSPLLAGVKVLEENYVKKQLKKPGRIRRAKLYYVTKLAPHLLTIH